MNIPAQRQVSYAHKLEPGAKIRTYGFISKTEGRGIILDLLKFGIFFIISHRLLNRDAGKS